MPNPTYCIPYAVRGQAFNLSDCIVSSMTGNPLSGTLSSFGAKVSKDDGPFATTTNAPVQILDTDGTTGTGFFSLDLTATEMTASKVVVQVFASNTGAVACRLVIRTVYVGPLTGRFDAQPVIRLENVWQDEHAYLVNQNSDMGASQQIMNADGSLRFSGTITEGDSTAVRGKLS